jgi:protein SCO1/2
MSRLPGLMMVLGVVVILLLGTSYVWFRNLSTGDQPVIGGPFTLVDSNGKAVTDRDFHGKYLLVYFGYTSCPDVCPTTLNEITSALDSLGAKAARVQPVFVTIDPHRDTPSVIRQYTASFGPRLIGLTGTPEQIAAVEKEYHVYAAVHRTGNGPNDYTMDHSSIIYLKRRQIGQLALHLGQVLAGDSVHGFARPLFMIGKVEQRANLSDGKAQVAGAARKSQAAYVVG